MNLSRLQILAITIGVLTFVGGSVAQLDTLFGSGVEKIIVAALTLVTGGLSVVMTVVSGPSSQFANVKSMDGVSRIMVNENTTPQIAVSAVGNDPKVVAEKGTEQKVEELAKQA